MLSANAVVARPALPESPFRGIESFRYVDQPIFFARGEETRRLLRYVSVYRGVLFYGESGCGKSSLINAGFIPAIMADGFTPDRLRVQPKPGEEIVVERISTKDTGEAPYLPSNFIASEESSSRIVLSADKLRARLQQLLISSPARRPLLIFDQFEEFATLFDEAPRGEEIQQAKRAQQAVLNLIIELQRDASLPVKLLFSFREDYLAKLSKLIALWPDLSDQSQRLTAPSIDSLPRIIRGSFEKYPGSFGKELSPELTSELSAALEARNEGGKLNLSEVQIACLQLWKSDDPEALFESKGVQGLLEDYLSDSLNRLAEGLRDPAIALVSRMVTPSGTRNIVSEYDLISQVQEDEGIPEDRLREALRALVEQTRLVRRERRYDTYFYDIVSEFLVPWISRQKVERLAASERQKLEAILRRRRKRALVVAAASLLVIVAVGLAALYYIRFQRQAGYLKILQAEEVKRARDAEAQAYHAENKAKQAEESAREAEMVAIAEKMGAELARLEAEKEKSLAEQKLSVSEQKLSASEQARAKSDAQYAQLKADYEKLRKSESDAFARANATARKQASEAYGGVRAAATSLGDMCNSISGSPYIKQDSGLQAALNRCTKTRNELISAMAGIRKIGGDANVQE
jgi:hypothetical protein